MEINFKDSADITYMSELIPLHSCRMQEGGLIRTHNLLTLCVRKLCAH